MVVETFASDIGWIEPRDLSVDAFIDELAPEPTLMEWWLKPPLPDWRRRPYERGIIMFDQNVYFANGDLPPKDAKTLVRADEPRYRLPASLQGRNRLPAILADFPISENVIRGTGFFTLLGATIGLLLAVRGRVPLSRESEEPAPNFAETS